MHKIIAVLLAMLRLLPMTGAFAESQESGWQNILMLGGDARNMDGYDRTDTMMILSINRDEALVKLTSIMRDTWVSFPGTGKSGKINAANVYGGPELAVETVNTCFGTDIEDYVIVNMEDLQQIVDLLGGVDIEITESERKQINEYVKGYMQEVSGASSYDGAKSLDESGMVHLNGMLAVGYSRIRMIDSDYNRVMRQQKILLALAEKRCV